MSVYRVSVIQGLGMRINVSLQSFSDSGFRDEDKCHDRVQPLPSICIDLCRKNSGLSCSSKDNLLPCDSQFLLNNTDRTIQIVSIQSQKVGYFQEQKCRYTLKPRPKAGSSGMGLRGGLGVANCHPINFRYQPPPEPPNIVLPQTLNPKP